MGRFQFSSEPMFGDIRPKQVAEALNFTDISFDALLFAKKILRDGEAFCWIDGKHKRWFADLVVQIMHASIASERTTAKLSIDEQDELNTIREFAASHNYKMPGWGAILDVLCGDAASPVVITYSVTNDFPSAVFAPQDWRPDLPQDKRYDAFDELPEDEQWKLTMPELRRLHPERQILPKAELVATLIADAVGKGQDPHEIMRAALIDIALRSEKTEEREAALSHLPDEDRAIARNSWPHRSERQ